MAVSSIHRDHQASLRRWWTIAGLVLLAEVLVLFGMVSWIWISDWYRHTTAEGTRMAQAPQALQSPSVDLPVASSETGEQPASRRLDAPQAAVNAATTRIQLPADDLQVLPAAPGSGLPSVPARSPITRIVIPAIGVDRGIETVEPYIVEDAYGPVQLWGVPKYAVGHHADSGLPGDQTNIVLTGHVGGSDPVFHRLVELKTGDLVLLYQETGVVTYTVETNQRLQEVGVSVVQQQENARVLDPTPTEVVTLITCWPATGPNAYDQRVVIRAVPLGRATASPAPR